MAVVGQEEDQRLPLQIPLLEPGQQRAHVVVDVRHHRVDAGGHVLWHPARDTILLYAFDLPPLPEGNHYRVRLRLGDGRVEDGPVFRPGPRGDVALPIRLTGGAAHLREVQVVRDSTAEPVLAGQTRPLPSS